jgi:hypothetical protein
MEDIIRQTPPPSPPPPLPFPSLPPPSISHNLLKISLSFLSHTSRIPTLTQSSSLICNVNHTPTVYLLQSAKSDSLPPSFCQVTLPQSTSFNLPSRPPLVSVLQSAKSPSLSLRPSICQVTLPQPYYFNLPSHPLLVSLLQSAKSPSLSLLLSARSESPPS